MTFNELPNMSEPNPEFVNQVVNKLNRPPWVLLIFFLEKILLRNND